MIIRSLEATDKLEDSSITLPSSSPTYRPIMNGSRPQYKSLHCWAKSSVPEAEKASGLQWGAWNKYSVGVYDQSAADN